MEKIRIRSKHPGSYLRELGNNFLGKIYLQLEILSGGNMGKELLCMCRLIISLRAKIPVAEMKKSAKIYVINVRISFGGKNPQTANLDRQLCRGSQQRYTGGVWRIF
jgi:hypothetical protein